MAIFLKRLRSKRYAMKTSTTANMHDNLEQVQLIQPPLSG